MSFFKGFEFRGEASDSEEEQRSEEENWDSAEEEVTPLSITPPSSTPISIPGTEKQEKQKSKREQSIIAGSVRTVTKMTWLQRIQNDEVDTGNTGEDDRKSLSMSSPAALGGKE